MKKSMVLMLLFLTTLLLSACDLFVIYEPPPPTYNHDDVTRRVTSRIPIDVNWPRFPTETPFLMDRDALISEPLYHSVDLLMPLSESAFIDVRYVGRDHQVTTNRRDFVDIYHAYYHDQDAPIEVFVSAQYGQYHATLVIAIEYAELIGQLPVGLRSYLNQVYVSQKRDHPVVMSNHGLYLPLHQPMETSLRQNMLLDTILKGVYFHFDQASLDRWHDAMVSDRVVITEASMKSSLNDFQESVKLFLALTSPKYDFSDEEKNHVESALHHRFGLLNDMNINPVEPSIVPVDALLSALPLDAPLYNATNSGLLQVLTMDDPTSFIRLVREPNDTRLVYDRRVGWVEQQSFIFTAYFRDIEPIEMIVNLEFDNWGLAYNIAGDYAALFGRLPTALKSDVETFWIHQGMGQFGGYHRTVLIHVEYADRFIQPRGNLIDVIAHETAHAVLDWTYDGKIDRDAWLSAAEKDGTYISQYAKNYPEREDIAETIAAYMLVRFYPERTEEGVIQAFERILKHRFELLDTLGLEPYQHPVE